MSVESSLSSTVTLISVPIVMDKWLPIVMDKWLPIVIDKWLPILAEMVDPNTRSRGRASPGMLD
jgi:hypothetical protein